MRANKPTKNKTHFLNIKKNLCTKSTRGKERKSVRDWSIFGFMFFFPIYKLYCLSFYYLNNILHKLFKEHFSTLFNICMFTTFRPYIGVREMFINSSGGTKQTTKKYTIKKLSVNFSFIFAQKAILRKSKFDFYLFFFFCIFLFFFFCYCCLWCRLLRSYSFLFFSQNYYTSCLYITRLLSVSADIYYPVNAMYGVREWEFHRRNLYANKWRSFNIQSIV